MPTLALSAHTFADFIMLATGAYAPLEGFLGPEDYVAVVKQMHLQNGALWPIPITLPVENQFKNLRGKVQLSWQDKIIGSIDVEGAFQSSKEWEAQHVFDTSSPKHPGVNALFQQGDWNLFGPVKLAEHIQAKHTPEQVKNKIKQMGWKSVAAFQTRNPLHKGHEYLHQLVLKQVDGLLLHPLTGPTKVGDIPAHIRMQTYQALLPFYPAGRILLSPYSAAMRYAGPREALLHALSRKNYGITHFIVGRDHAGVNGLYSPDAAQKLLDQFTKQELGLQILHLPPIFYCSGCGGATIQAECPHSPDQHIELSGTAIRRYLEQGKQPPTEWMRPEVSQILLEHGLLEHEQTKLTSLFR